MDTQFSASPKPIDLGLGRTRNLRCRRPATNQLRHPVNSTLAGWRSWFVAGLLQVVLTFESEENRGSAFKDDPDFEMNLLNLSVEGRQTKAEPQLQVINSQLELEKIKLQQMEREIELQKALAKGQTQSSKGDTNNLENLIKSVKTMKSENKDKDTGYTSVSQGSSTRGEFTSYKPAFLQAARKLAQCTHRTRLKAAFKKPLEKVDSAGDFTRHSPAFERFRL
ncbi:hypothetical protein TNCV_3204321 [Trichonephila clavipes]|nr:hypothetical protein TNCV_3204321 [Trichonephila clavipes]